ncbi:MAG: hypothetical protein EAZ53_07215 [Bacteroidetes bacterium]|nr:MAG: hypothetical protein EAZ53_07215 [Bacteroidota bacterium]
MIAKTIQKAFPICESNQCLLEITNNLETKILDQNNSKCIIIEYDDFHFLASNPNYTELYFLAIDKCLLFDNENQGEGRADFAIISKNEFCIVEIKDTFRNRNAHKTTINKQLEDTIIYCLENNAILEIQKRILVQCWSYKPSRPAMPSKQNAYKYFYDKFNAELLEGNNRVFL